MIFDNKEKIEPEHIKIALLEVMDELKSSWLYPLYRIVYETLQDSKMNKQV